MCRPATNPGGTNPGGTNPGGTSLVGTSLVGTSRGGVEATRITVGDDRTRHDPIAITLHRLIPPRFPPFSRPAHHLVGDL